MSSSSFLAGPQNKAPVARGGQNHSSEQAVDDISRYWSDFVEARRTVTHFAYTGDGDHENAGIYTKGGGAYLGVEAVHLLFKIGDFKLEVPPGAQGIQRLYAPTTRPPNGGCLEVGTAYTTIAGQANTSVHVYVYDFCSSPRRFTRTIVVDDTFLHQYAREQAPGVLAYKIRIMPDSGSISSRTKWSAMIYNYTDQNWTTLSTSRGFVRSDLNGWSIFETWYKKGQCSKTLKSISATEIAYYNALNDKWEPIADHMPPLVNQMHSGGNCFMNQDSNNLASYTIMQLQSAHGWKVSGTNH